MKILILASLSMGLVGCFENGGLAVDTNTPGTEPKVCSPAWYQQVEERIITGDGQGHGPDLGSAEWRSVVEFRLGIRDHAEVPAADSDAWCRYIDRHFMQADD